MIEEIDEVEALAELRRRVYYYRMAGELVDEISDRLSIPPKQVVKLYKDFIRAAVERADMDTPDSSRQMEIDRCDTLMRAHWELATGYHEQDVVVGTGRAQRVERISVAPDPRAAKVVLDAMTMRTRLMGIDGSSSLDPATVQNILIVGNDQKSYLEALAAGREQKPLSRAQSDNENGVEIEGEVVGGGSA